MIHCHTEGRQRVFYHYLDFKAANMNKIFFKFAKFWWFCLLEIPQSDVSAQCVIFSDKQLAVCHCCCKRSMQLVWDHFACYDWTSQEIWRIFSGKQRMACQLFAYPLKKISKIHKSTSLLLRCFPVNFLHSKLHFPRSDLWKPGRAVKTQPSIL